MCPDLSDPENGEVTVNGHRTDHTAVYSCNDGFKLVGHKIRTCLRISRWSGEEPVCRSDPGNKLIINVCKHIMVCISNSQ